MSLYAFCGYQKKQEILNHISHISSQKKKSPNLYVLICLVWFQKTVIIEPNKSQKPTKEKISKLICPYMPYVVAKTRNIEPY